MANRREFLQGSAALLALVPGFVAALDASYEHAALPLHGVVFDARVAESRRFAAAFAAQGAATYALVTGDITYLWRDALAAAWRRAPEPLAGLTDASVLFCLEQLGRQHGLRVVYREERASGLVAWVVAPRDVG